jgi:putative transposase
MLKAFKYRIYPTEAQAVLLNKHIGSSRFVYNLALETKQMAYAGNKTNLTCFDLIKQLPDLKKEIDWLKEINSQSLQQSIVNLDVAFTKFFKGEGGYPNFKKKISRQSFNVPQSVELVNGKLSIPKFKNEKGIEIVLHRPIKGDIRQATISKTPTGKYFASILAETNTTVVKKKAIKEKTTVGIDLGLKTFIVGSDNSKFKSPKYLRKSEGKLKYIQRKYSINKGKRTKKKLTMLHEKVANQRKDFLHKTSSDIVKNHDSIAIEDLNIKGMSARCKPKQDENGTYLPNGQAAKSGLNKSIADAGWGMFVTMLEYKAEWYGKNILRIGRFEPSSKMCSCCGRINKELTLEDREWTCKGCGTKHDRDVNAAINIKNFALKKYLSTGRRRKTRNELPTLVGVMTYEAPSPLGKG